MTEEPPNLILEHLRALREGQGTLRQDIREVKDSHIAIRQMLAAMQSDALRQEAVLAALRVDVDLIKRRLKPRRRLTRRQPSRPATALPTCSFYKSGTASYP